MKENNNLVMSYYKKRVEEIFQPRFNGQDIFVSRWELDGIIDYIKTAKDKEGHNLYPLYKFEHGKEVPSIHPYGKYTLLHMNVQVESCYGSKIKRHLLITNDPYDVRINNIGLDLSKGKIINSKVYSPNHPRYSLPKYKRKINITFEKPE